MILIVFDWQYYRNFAGQGGAWQSFCDTSKVQLLMQGGEIYWRVSLLALRKWSICHLEEIQ